MGDRAMVHKLYICPVKEVPGVTGAYDIVASTTAEDRDREAIAASAWGNRIQSFLKHPILVSSHDYGDLRKQIGEVTNLAFTSDGMAARVQYYVGKGNEEADWAAFLASKGRAAYSVGFIPFEWEDGDVTAEGVATGPRRRFTDCELLEISHVILGSNREALVTGLAKGFGSPELNEYAKGVLAEIPVEQKEGRVLSAKDHSMFAAIVNDLKGAVKSIEDYLKANGPKEEDEDKAAIPYKKTPLADMGDEWDAGAEVAKAEPEELKRMCAWYNADEPDVKASYKLPHHKAGGENPCVWRAVVGAMGALFGARGGVNIPDDERRGVYNHLVKHYEDFGREAPDFKAASAVGLFVDLAAAPDTKEEAYIRLERALAGGLQDEGEIEAALALRDKLNQALGETAPQVALATARRAVADLSKLDDAARAEALELSKALAGLEPDVVVDVEAIRRLVSAEIQSVFQ